MKNLACPRFRRRFAFSLVISALAFACVVPNATAQIDTGAVSGRVTDQTNAVVGDAQVQIKNTEAGIATTVKTNGDGIYVFPSLKPGSYVMSVSKEGFSAVSVTGLTLSVQDSLVRNFVLQVGSSAESITVNAEAVAIQSGDAQLGTAISQKRWRIFL